MERTLVRDLFQEKPVEQTKMIKGWVRSVRKSKKFSFIVVNDGSGMDSLQIVADADLENYEEVSSMLTGTAVEIEGLVVQSGGRPKVLKWANESMSLVLLMKVIPFKEAPLEFLREKAHLNSNKYLSCCFRIRHELGSSTSFF